MTMVRYRWVSGLPSLLLLLAAAPSMAFDDDAEFSASLALSSDVLFRGVSQTLGSPGLEVYADVSLNSGLYAYVWGSNVDFVPDNEPDDGARTEIDFAIGYSRSLGERLAVDLVFVRYVFPSTVDNYDYSELIATLSLNEQYHTTIGYSNDVFGADASGFYYAVGSSHDLARNLSMEFELGYYDLDDAFDASYSFAGIGIGRPVGRVDLSLAYYDTFGDTQDIYYDQSAGSRWVLSAEYEF